MKRLRSISMFSLGFLCAAAILPVLAEAILRCNPPPDTEVYLGESSDLSDGFARHPDWAVTYRSWQSFYEQNKPQLAPHLPLTNHPDKRPVWAFFGNSFIQAPGMLGDTASRSVPEKRAFYLKRNELLPLRLAQIELLLESGFRPERIVVELMPIDTLPLLRHPLDCYVVTSRGGLTYRPRMPNAPWRWAVEHSRLGLTAWVRLGLQDGNPGNLLSEVPEGLRKDLDRLFGHLARTTRSYGIPVTILLIPAYEQVVDTTNFVFNDSVINILAAHGFEILDPREAFTSHSDPRQLYIPDKHLSAAGNDLLLRELLAVSASPPRQMTRQFPSRILR